MSRPIQAISNSFPITRLPTKDYYMYDVVFSPVIEDKERSKRNQLFHHLQVTIAPQLFNPRLVYDGRAIAYSPGLLNLGGNSGMTFTVSLGNKSQPTAGTRGSYQIRINLTSSPKIVPSDVKDLIVGGKVTTRSTTAVNLIQLIVRQGPNQNHTNNGRAYFTGRDKKSIDRSGLELWRGIFQSVRPAMGKMILTIDTSTAAVYKSGPLIDVALDFLNFPGPRNVRNLQISERDPNFKRLEKFLKKLRIKVKTGVNGSKSRIKTIRGLVPEAGRVTFEKDDETTTVERHFAQTYGIRLSQPQIFGVRLTGKHSQHRDVVPAELCDIELGQLYRQKLPENLTSEMVKFSTMKPHVRLQKIMEGAVAYNRSEYIVESGMQLDSKALTVQAKSLMPPQVAFAKGQSINVSDGKWNVLGKIFFQPGILNSWALVNFCPERISPQACQKMAQDLGKACGDLGMRVEGFHGVYPGNGHNVENDLTRVMDTISRNFHGDLARISTTILIILLPQSAAAIRAAVKHWGDINNGIRTSCLRDGKILNSQYWNNVALKINARLGGINSIGISPAMEQFKQQPFMIMGADVGHPGPGVQKPSVTSLVYSHDKHGAQYVAITGIQNPRTEIIENLRDFVGEALDNFGSKNGPPRNLVMFRDGVSEGEYEAVAEHEIKAIKAAIQDVWTKRKVEKPEPNLTFIVVGKRHHAVFFPTSPRDADRTGNFSPGVVIDTDITHPGHPNFYLQSHAAIQGTCRSSHYIVLHDEIFNKHLPSIQSIAYTLCNNYAKATRSVSIPAPVYYADLVCSRGAFHVSPGATLSFDDNASVASGQTTFDLSVWQSAFQQINRNRRTDLDKSMYFL
ncbi:argonaute-like protein [Pholiota conissans]|uniref:Argonaute-like protein n=1 Tax=Pholiota conissans TaxID=109636 RepID=A0A9P6D5V9_9AGAR|nr:argonaute-like protein [Pholiota conissans]